MENRNPVSSPLDVTGAHEQVPLFLSKHSYITVGRSEPWCVQQTCPEQPQGVCYDRVVREAVSAGEEVSWDDVAVNQHKRNLRPGSSFGFA